MLAVCHMESGEFDRAITALNQVRAENEFTVAIDYYKALCHIKTGNTTEATALLEKIRNHRNHPYSKNAKRMLRILK
jgi:thioredoxin-like negative regulator of GroEL